MNWFEKIEQRRKLIIGGIIVICLAMLIVTIRRNNASYDSFWHLKMGLDWLENNLSFWWDHFSFTFNDKKISGPPFMFQALLGWLVMQFGLDPGFEAYKLISFLLAFLLVIFFLHKLRSPVIIYLLVLPLIVVLLQLRSIVRPELISYSFSILAIILYYKAKNKISTTNMLSIVVLMLVWSNYHTSIFGYIIFFGFFIDLALEQIRQRAPRSTWLKWLLWGLAVFVVGFLKPGMHHSGIGAFFFSSEWKALIQEYHSALVYRSIPAIYSLIVIYFVTLALLMRNRQFGLLFICALLGYYSFTMSRLVTPSGIVILCTFAWAASEIDVRNQLQHMPQALRGVIGAIVMLVFIISLASSVYVAREYMKQNRIATQFPVDVTNYMIDHHIQGRIFNEYRAGGYLIYRLSPDSQVYIDGRTGILYPLDHFYRYQEVKKSADALRTEIEKYDIKLVLLLNQQRNYSLVHDTGMLGLDYVGNRYSLFRRNNPNFPVLGTLLASPACWNAEMSAALKAEQIKAVQILPRNSFLQPSFIKFIVDYTQAVDKEAFLSTLQINDEWSIFKLRFTAYQALSANLDTVAYDLFAKITDMEFGDFLGAALAQARLGDWKEAEQILDNATRQSVSYKPSEIKILHDLLVQIGKNSALELFDDAYIERIAVEVSPENKTILSKLPEVGDFCPETYASP